MKQVIESARSDKLALKQVPPPGGQSQASLISARTERMIIDSPRKILVRKAVDKMHHDGRMSSFIAAQAQQDEPMAQGYLTAGERPTLVDEMVQMHSSETTIVLPTPLGQGRLVRLGQG